MIDHHGYPTDATLEKIRDWDFKEWPVYDFVEYLEANWVNGAYFNFDKNTGCLEMSTGGWSGCESIMGALEGSFFWTLYWYQSRVGGHYWFKVKEIQASK